MSYKSDFEWDPQKNAVNTQKHGVTFESAQYAFIDHHRIILKDDSHSNEEDRFYCLGFVNGGVMTVRFTYRNNNIRIIGAGYWRKGKNIYEKENNIQ